MRHNHQNNKKPPGNQKDDFNTIIIVIILTVFCLVPILSMKMSARSSLIFALIFILLLVSAASWRTFKEGDIDKEKLQKILNWKSVVVLLLGVLFFFIIDALTAPSFKMTYCECRWMERKTYDNFTDEIRNLIAGENLDTTISQSFISNCGICDDAIGCEWCNPCQEKIGDFLNQAYSSIKYGDTKNARLILLRANIYLLLHPGCFNCGCLIPIHRDLPGV